MKEECKKIYIVLTYPGTILSRIIKFYTCSEFSHASLSLDKQLDEMYSFGRLNAYNPFVGGFVHENIKWGTFKRFKKTVTAIYSIEVTEEQYEIIRNIIEKLKEHKDDYKFNIMGLFGVAFHFKLSRNKKFYCAEFVKYLIEAANIELDLPELIKPNDFQYLRNLKLEYKGELYKYHLSFNYL